LWYVGAFSVVLLLFSVGVYFFVDRILHERLQTNLHSTLTIGRSAVAHIAVQESALPALENPAFSGQVIALLDREGRVLARQPLNSNTPLRLPSFPLHISGSPQSYDLDESREDADDSCSGVYQQVTDAYGQRYLLVVVESTEVLGDQLDTLKNVFVVAVGLACTVTFLKYPNSLGLGHVLEWQARNDAVR